MEAVLKLSLCKIFFASITLFMVILGILINILEPYLPVFVVRTFRYGKFASKEDSAVKKLEVPKSYFKHFYCVTALVYYPIAFYEVLWVYVFHNDMDDWFGVLLDFACGSDRSATVSATRVFIGVILLLVQAFRRFYDTHFVSVFSQNARMNLSHYLIGMLYYPAVMLIILSEAPKFSQTDDTVISILQFENIGIIEVFVVVLFLWAWYHQHVATVILANLRKNRKGCVVTQSYKIPEGDWFNYLSSPHSTAEIVMYSALSLLLSNNTGWWFVHAWIISNQVETILLSHWWYKRHFKNFPKDRSALIPFIY